MITVAAAYVAMRSNIPTNLWSTYVLNPIADINPFADNANAKDMKSVEEGTYVEQGQWNGIWLILSHGSPGHIHINEDLTASQFYTQFAQYVMKHQEHKATVIASCHSGNLENFVKRPLAKKAEVIFEHPWIRSESLESESLESEAREDKDEDPFKDEITGLTGYGYQDCLTEEFYRDKTINVCDILNALVKPQDNHSGGKDPDINQLPNDEMELPEDKPKEKRRKRRKKQKNYTRPNRPLPQI